MFLTSSNHQLDAAQVDFCQEKKRTHVRKKGFDDGLTRLTVAVAKAVIRRPYFTPLPDRERELTEIETSLRQEEHGFVKSSEELQQFVLKQLSSLPDLLSCDVPRARAELASMSRKSRCTRRNKTVINTIPLKETGICWETLPTQGTVGLLRVGAFEPPTVGL
jgi:hypothetical protein